MSETSDLLQCIRDVRASRKELRMAVWRKYMSNKGNNNVA